METAAIQTHGLTRRFGELTAVDDVTFSVAQGQFFGFLGPNGAGKSTTIKMLTGLLEPSAGTIEILGKPFSASALDLKRQIGVVPEGMALLGRLTAPEYLRFVGRMYGLDRETMNRRTEELLEFMQLANERRKLVTDFSHGMQKKLALAAAVIHGPKVLFLDEPFEGVDAIAAGMLKTHAAGNDQSRRDDFSDDACAGDCGAAVQPRGDHSPGTAGGERLDRRSARGRGEYAAGQRRGSRS